jgi:hypothetical protein
MDVTLMLFGRFFGLAGLGLEFGTRPTGLTGH